MFSTISSTPVIRNLEEIKNVKKKVNKKQMSALLQHKLTAESHGIMRLFL
jgi:hypothetical protein